MSANVSAYLAAKQRQLARRKWPHHNTIETDEMADVVNLRTARKQAKRRQSDRAAEVNRMAHGQSKNLRELEDAKQTKASRDLDGHRIETGDG